MGQTANESPKPATSALSRCSVPKTRLHPGRENDEREEADDDRRDAGEELDAGLTISRVRLPANSETKSAAATLSGTATTSETSVTFSVPTKSGTMLYLGTSLTGCQTNPAVAFGRKSDRA